MIAASFMASAKRAFRKLVTQGQTRVLATGE